MYYISYEDALKMIKSKWWKGKTKVEIATVQLFTDKLICKDFGVFQSAMDEAIQRPTWTHEYGFNTEGLRKEFIDLHGQPTKADLARLTGVSADVFKDEKNG